MTLKHVTLLPDRVGNWQEYPFSVPAIATLREITIHKPIVFFVGENGSGKSTLLEAIAIHYGFGREGGSRNLRTEKSTRAIPRRVLHFTGGKQVQQRRLLRDGRTRSGVVSATAIELIGDTA